MDDNFYRVPFNRPAFSPKENQYVGISLSEGQVSGGGPFTGKCQAFLEHKMRVPKVQLTTSGTHALELCALLLDIKPGDEVVLPSFTFVSTANAFVMRGARPVFVDIHPETLNMDETLLEELITPKTKAIIAMHYAGVGCKLDVIQQIADHHRIKLVEDNAQGLFGKYQGKYLGTFGCLSMASFHETKNFTCGEGGALFINNPVYIDSAEILFEKGTNRRQFLKGEIDKYTWVDIGSSFALSDILSSILLAQFENHEQILQQRKRIWTCYQTEIKNWAEIRDIRLPEIPPECEHPFHLFYLLMPNPDQRLQMIGHLKSKGVQAVFHYQPLHTSQMGLKFGGKPGGCPVAESVSERLVRLPLYNSMTEADAEYVISGVKSYNSN
jgi:dTDP-4-amino-4,6-dideoxygalactose transaminase